MAVAIAAPVAVRHCLGVGNFIVGVIVGILLIILVVYACTSALF